MQIATLSRRTRWASIVLLASSIVVMTGCSSSSSTTDSASPGAAASASAPTTLRLGFFPNLTHAPAYVGLQEGFYNDALSAEGVKVAPQLFNAGPDAVTALFSGAIDIAFVGPNPTVNAWTQSQGAAVNVISGSTSGGASLVVQPDITKASDLAGQTLATPQLGNTQDVALRYWLKQQGYATTPEGGGDVKIQNISNSDAVTAFQSKQISGAWVPEPFATQMVSDGGVRLVDERSLWPKGQFVTTDIVVRSEFLKQYPNIVKSFLTGNVEAINFINKNPAQAQVDFNDGLKSLTGSTVDTTILGKAWKEVTFTNDPLPATLAESAKHAVDVGLLDQSAVDAAGGFDGLYDLTLLNQVLAKANEPQVKQ